MSVSNATAAGQGQAQPGDVPGQAPGTADAGQGQDGFWGLFPGVPEEQRSALEPHIKGMQRYITGLQAELTPYKALQDAGIGAEDVQAVIQFGGRMQQDPVGTAFQLLEQLQQSGQLAEDLDLEAVRAIAEGRELEAGTEDIVEPGAVEPGNGEMPVWATALQEQMGQVTNYLQTQAQQTQQRTQDAAFNKLLGNARTELQKAKVDIDSMFEDPKDGEKYLASALITNQMDVAKAVGQIVGFRDAATKGLMEETEDGPDTDLDLPNGTPGVRPKPTGGDAFSSARAGAMNELTRRNRAAAQGV